MINLTFVEHLCDKGLRKCFANVTEKGDHRRGLDARLRRAVTQPAQACKPTHPASVVLTTIQNTHVPRKTLLRVLTQQHADSTFSNSAETPWFSSQWNPGSLGPFRSKLTSTHPLQHTACIWNIFSSFSHQWQQNPLIVFFIILFLLCFFLTRRSPSLIPWYRCVCVWQEVCWQY